MDRGGQEGGRRERGAHGIGNDRSSATGAPAQPQHREWTGGQFIPSSEACPQVWYSRCPNCHQDTFNPWIQMCEDCCTLQQQHHTFFQQPPISPYAAAAVGGARKGFSFESGIVFSRDAADAGTTVELAERFEAVPIDPIRAVKSSASMVNVEVVERCCLDSLRKMEGKPCLVVMIEEGLPLRQNNGSALAVVRGSSLCDLIEGQAATNAEPVSLLPKHGGYYARSVHVHQLSDLTTVSFESPMVLMKTL